MKKIIVFIFCFCTLTSCMEDEDRDQFGFTFSVVNSTESVHEGVVITIGGMQNGEFIGTSSYNFPIIEISEEIDYGNGNIGLTPQTFAFYEERWNPDLSQVKAISERAYFMIQFKGEDPKLILNDRNNDEFLSVSIPDNNIIKNLYGLIDLSIRQDGVFGEMYNP